MHSGDFLRLARPHFLVGGVLLYAVGALAAGVTSVAFYLLGQLAVTTSQLTAHFVNEYSDVDADRLVVNRTWFSGGSGALVRDSSARGLALRAAIMTTALSLGASALLAIERPIAGLIAAATLVISWNYSMPPVRLLSTGWGEAATSLVVTMAVPLVGALGQSRIFPSRLWLVMASLFFIHMAMIITFELPDIDTDRDAGKLVLAVRLGRSATHRLIVGSYLIGFGLAASASVLVNPALAWIFLGSPAALVTISSLRTERFSILTTAAVSSLGLGAIGALVGLSI